MARKEINVFGTSFLDLLSGALAAVIILFVIVPKMSAADQQAMEEITQAGIQVTELAEIMQQLENSVPQEQYDAIMRQIEELQNTIDRLSERVATMQQQLAQSRQENERLRQEVEQLRQQAEQAEQQQQRIAELEEQLNRQRQASQVGRIFGVDAELGVVCLWRENIDVDLYVTDLSSNETCYYHKKVTSFGQLNEDITSREDSNDDRYELFYQRHIKPGRYRLAVNIYSQASMSHASSAHVEGYVTLHPGKANEIKIPYRRITLTTPGQMVTIGVLTVTENNINLQQQ